MDVPTIVVKPGEGRSVSLGGMGVVFKVSGGGHRRAFAVMEHPIEPGRLVLPHVHLHEDEYSYVLERDDQYESRGPRGRRGAGQLSDQAPRAMHTFWNAGPGSVWQRNTGAYSLVWVAELTSKFDLKLLGQ